MGAIISKTQPAFVRHGTAVYKALPRIAWNDPNFGDNYSLRCKNIQEYFRSHYNELCCQYSQTSQNSFFYRMLVKSYTYKGPVEEWYVRIKVKMEKQYDRFHKLLPLDARILDIGCGYGMLCYMMAMQAPQRKLTGIDYDSDKIDVALHNFLKNDNTDFIAADALECDLPKSDAIILNDVLHYMSSEKQQILLKKCLAVLSPKGMMIVRDGNRDEVKKQRITRLSEVFSTRIFFFNKTREQLCFLSASQMQRFADENALKMETCKNDRITSNTIFIFRRP
jgi:2-polyprenyl-3-methyl-5-hydroxy-6-metoxy-1,4-benzoquinol methylase